jgi:ABC-2 type transport system ATP-binding protein
VASLGAEQIVEFRVRPDLSPEVMTGLVGVSSVVRTEGTWKLSVRRIGEALPALLAEIERQEVVLESLATHQATLEDVFVSMTGRALRDE